MQHDDHVGALRQRLAIAGHLIAPVTVVAVVLEDVQAKAVGQVDGVVGTVVVDEDADVDEAGQFSYGDFESLFRIVGGHDDRHALAVNHGSGLGLVYPRCSVISASRCLPWLRNTKPQATLRTQGSKFNHRGHGGHRANHFMPSRIDPTIPPTTPPSTV